MLRKSCFSWLQSLLPPLILAPQSCTLSSYSKKFSSFFAYKYLQITFTCKISLTLLLPVAIVLLLCFHLHSQTLKQVSQQPSPSSQASALCNLNIMPWHFPPIGHFKLNPDLLSTERNYLSSLPFHLQSLGCAKHCLSPTLFELSSSLDSHNVGHFCCCVVFSIGILLLFSPEAEFFHSQLSFLPFCTSSSGLIQTCYLIYPFVDKTSNCSEACLLNNISHLSFSFLLVAFSNISNWWHRFYNKCSLFILGQFRIHFTCLTWGSRVSMIQA